MPKASFAELRALRASGKKRLDTYKVEQEEDLYEVVDEEGYKKVVRERLNQDDFVVDDNGEGYADDGREDWSTDTRVGYYSDSEDGLPLKGKALKRKREADKAKRENNDKDISKFFQKGPAVPPPKAKVASTAEDDAFMAGLLGEVDHNVTTRISFPVKTVKSEARRKTRVLSPPIEQTKLEVAKTAKGADNSRINTPPAELDFDDDFDYSRGVDDDGFVPSDQVLPSSPVTKAVERKAKLLVKVEEDDDEDMMEAVQATGVAAVSVNMSGSRPAPKIQNQAYPSPMSSSPARPLSDAVDASAWNDVTQKLNVLCSPAPETMSFGKLSAEQAIEDDGSLLMFWLDYAEVNGSLCLFGKVKNKKMGTYVSCFVKVDNILRKLFFLPREYRKKNGRDTSEEIEMNDVYDEVDNLMTKLKVGMFKIKPCSRKYAFELPGIPKEADYLKLLYPYTNNPLPIDTQGETFSHVFGTNTALFEQFVLWRNIMGPCWLRIVGGDFKPVQNASWCKLELQVSAPGDITPLGESDGMDPPPLTLMSLALRTTLNAKENKQEILAVSARIYQNISLNDVTAPEKLPCQTITIMRPAEQSFPVGFEIETKKHRGGIKLEKTEMAVLSSFLAKLQIVDPDVLMGHQLEGVDYSILLSRMRERKTPQWHRIGRMKRSEWPKNLNRMGGNFFAERQLLSGRLLCDLANDMGKSLMTKCQSWSLTEMCSLYLSDGSPRHEIDNEAALKTWATSREGLMNYLNHVEADTYFIAALALKVQMLPLTKVLTNLAGNSWARTLGGTRAERNEYILLHEFHRNKYICPDKVPGKGRPIAEEETLDGEEGTDIKKKDKYKGGLVFEPEKGLYDKFILVMDFNSLYPSIIQEFNICFTTVERSELPEGEDKVPDVPSDQAQGILPKLIATLVNRRRQVKSLMKDKRATPDQLATYDIKQLALKLTANSMYGCLGYTRSRFYARPLAMLTTFKGREILRSTKELAESSALRVIYGDTDSVMINTNMDNVDDALKVGHEFKRAVNDRYKLLEIDIDNIFRRLLLQAKKKYAAINMLEIDGKFIDKLEVKGLDMKRREYCSLSKEASSKLLNEILSGDETEIVIERIHEYLRELAEKMRAGKIPTQKYIIYTKLGKHPNEYPNGDSMPQVQVALRELSRGKTIRKDDVISYIITGDSKTTSESAAKRSYTPQDVLKTDSGLTPDSEWYLIKQILPPVERLCANISGTDTIRLADCLGLDTRKYALNTSNSRSADSEIQPLESQIPEAIRFQNATRLSLRCRTCTNTFTFEGLTTSLDICTPAGLSCPAPGCSAVLSPLSVLAQLEHQIRAQTSRYYEAWLVCDDAACGNRTRQMNVYGHRCLGPRGLASGCLGKMRYEYGEKDLYNQLLYFASLWDVDKAKNDAKGDTREKVLALAEHNRVQFGTLKGVVDKYLDKCGRRWVAMDSLFGFALKAAVVS